MNIYLYVHVYIDQEEDNWIFKIFKIHSNILTVIVS